MLQVLTPVDGEDRLQCEDLVQIIFDLAGDVADQAAAPVPDRKQLAAIASDLRDEITGLSAYLHGMFARAAEAELLSDALSDAMASGPASSPADWAPPQRTPTRSL